MTNDDPNGRLIPLALLAPEFDQSVDQLAHRLGDDMVLDELGIRCCTCATARALFAQRAQQKAEQARRNAEHRERMAEISRRNPPRRGIPASSGNAYADMIGFDER